MKNSSTAFVGLDVHKGSIDIANAEIGRSGEVRHYDIVDGALNSLAKAVRKFRSRQANPGFSYEAGSCGYEIYRYLSNLGLGFAVIAPSIIPRVLVIGSRLIVEMPCCQLGYTGPMN